MNSTHHTHRQKGFSTVELLVSLIVAAIFLFAGFSFYNSIVRFSTESRNRATADRIAYSNLRKYESSVATTCADSTPVNQVSLSGDATARGLNTPTLTIAITCPLSSVPSVSKVTATVRYKENSGTKSVVQEVYASR